MSEPRRTGDPTKTLVALAAAFALAASACSRPASRSDDVAVAPEPVASAEVPAPPPEVSRVTDNRILLHDLASGQTSEIARNGTCLSLWSPVFAFDDLVLLDARGYEIPRYTHTSVCGVDLRKKSPVVNTVASGTDCVTAIRSGPHRGHLYAEGYRSPGPTEYFAIVDRSGRAVRELEASAITEDPPEGPVAQTGAFCRPPRRLDFEKK
ncbi:hypothetical protein [Polyangium sp. 15x6]|uniref:hypothetical protein n=1 Tax=Polyangium sp. 15x6 TaxID=3042687 RepID=UPI00249C5CAF|nr:hypothetical protein [Polyangium sp. 15x6]MDI3289882.1 hypothetical protein [Polyangium sp. 15x6]